MIRKVESPLAPAAIGPYSQATAAGSTVYVAGEHQGHSGGRGADHGGCVQDHCSAAGHR